MTEIQSALVTGSNRGIGFELVCQLSTRRPRLQYIFAACRDPEKAKDLQKLAEDSKDVQIIPIALDVENEETLQSALAEVTKHIQDSGLDLLINNAAICDEATLEQVTVERLEKSFKVNVVGPLMVAKTFLPLLRQATVSKKDGSTKAIVNISSRSGMLTNPILPGITYPYKISKTALNSVTVQMAEDLKAEGIIVISVCPGWVRTDMGGPKAPLTPQKSVSGTMELINKLSMEHTSKFYTHEGELVLW